MNRPSVSVVMPFAGDRAEATEALRLLAGLERQSEDELILVDNSGAAQSSTAVTVVRATRERSPAHARNVGAHSARGEWILFLDSDCIPPSGLIDAYFQVPVGDSVGALAGAVVPAPGARTLAARYATARNFLDQSAHLAHPYLPRAVAANLLVRRAVFVQLGGFVEGLRTAEDTDFSWRLQRAGYGLELRQQAKVEHHYRARLSQLRAQWRAYAAGRAWLGRRYIDFEPQPAVRRVLARIRRRATAPSEATARRRPGLSGAADGRLERTVYLALDAELALEELVGLLLSNRPSQRQAPRRAPAVVWVAERFSAKQDRLRELESIFGYPRIEAGSRPESPSSGPAAEFEVRWREDDGTALRVGSLALLVCGHPLRCAFDRIGRSLDAPSLAAIAPAALRVRRLRGAQLYPLDAVAQETAMRLGALSARGIQQTAART